MNKVKAIETMNEELKALDEEFSSKSWHKPRFWYESILHSIVCNLGDETFVFGLSRKASLAEWIDNLTFRLSFSKDGFRIHEWFYQNFMDDVRTFIDGKDNFVERCIEDIIQKYDIKYDKFDVVKARELAENIIDEAGFDCTYDESNGGDDSLRFIYYKEEEL